MDVNNLSSPLTYIDNPCTDPTWNLALEEYLLVYKSDLENILLLWRNQPSVIIGRHQNAVEEINMPFVKAQNIKVVRRPSGGGAVYHDLGNLNFSFIMRDEGPMLDFHRFTRPVIAALNSLGVPAHDEGRNDISIKGRKISGNAQLRRQGRVLHHGTLLFDTDLAVMSQVLQVNEDKFVSHAVSSVRSRVANISEFVATEIDILQFRALLLQHIGGLNCTHYTLNTSDQSAIARLQQEKYQTYAWNIGQGPAYTLQQRQRFVWGELDIRLNIRQGKISQLRFYGDYFSPDDPDVLANRLLGVEYTAEAIAQTVPAELLYLYFPQLEHGIFMRLMMGEGADNNAV